MVLTMKRRHFFRSILGAIAGVALAQRIGLSAIKISVPEAVKEETFIWLYEGGWLKRTSYVSRETAEHAKKMLINSVSKCSWEWDVHENGADESFQITTPKFKVSISKA